MERILLLNDKRFPSYLMNVNITPPTGVSKVAYVEDRIITAINNYNPKLDVKRIEYLAIETQFSYFKKGEFNGVLVEELEIPSSEQSRYVRNGCYVYSNGSKCFCRRIMQYVFVSKINEDARISFISQTVFPALLEYADEFMDSPSFTISNHKFCFVNVLNKTITSSMILRHLAGLCAAGVDYVEVFPNSTLNPSKIPSDVKAFLNQYSSDYAGGFNALSNIYEDDYYLIDFNLKKVLWKTASMISKLKTVGGVVNFYGSDEKFYWIEILPLSIFAYDQGYKVDYSDYEKFVMLYKARFSPSSNKFKRCEVLLEYAKKYFI